MGDGTTRVRSAMGKALSLLVALALAVSAVPIPAWAAAGEDAGVPSAVEVETDGFEEALDGGQGPSLDEMVSEHAHALQEAEAFLKAYGGTELSYTFAFEANGGSGEMDDLSLVNTVGKRDQFKLPANRFERAGYEFVGWYPEIPDDYGEREAVCIPDGQPILNMSFEANDGSFVNLDNYVGEDGLAILVAGWRDVSTGEVDDGGVSADAAASGVSASGSASSGDVRKLYRYTKSWTGPAGISDTYYFLSTSESSPSAFGGNWTQDKTLGRVSVTETASPQSDLVYLWDYTRLTKGANDLDMMKSQMCSFNFKDQEKLWKKAYNAKGLVTTSAGFYLDRSSGTPLYWAANNKTSAHKYDSKSIQGSSWLLKSVHSYMLDKVSAKFKANGGSGTMGDQALYRYVRHVLKANAFTRKGHVFTGWNTKADGSGVAYAGGASITASADVTLYAQWEPSGYDVVFDANGAKGSTASRHYSYGEAKALPANGFDRPGYTFTGWNARPDGSGTSYAEGQVVSNLAESGTVILYAQWVPWSYAVRFDANGGSGSMALQAMTCGAPMALPASAFERAKYTFGGWNTRSDGAGDPYADRGVADILPPSNGATVTLYAQWVPEDARAVTYHLHGGSGSFPAQVVAAGDEVVLHVATPAPPAGAARPYRITYDANGGSCPTAGEMVEHDGGFEFKCWNTEEAGTGQSFSPGERYRAESNLALHAVWISTGTTGAVVLPVAERAGKKFLGWATSLAATSGMTGSYTPTGDVTLHAVWGDGEVHSVSYDANGGYGAPASQLKAEGEPLALSFQRPVRSTSSHSFTVAYDARGGSCTASADEAVTVMQAFFVGWNESADGSGKTYYPGDEYSDERDVTLYAQWRFATSAGSVDLPIPSREGFLFAGWSDDPGATSGVVGKYQPARDVTLHAVWIMLDSNEVSYNANGGSGEPAAQSKIQGVPLALSPNEPARVPQRTELFIGFDANGGECDIASVVTTRTVSYEFLGWNTGEDGLGSTYLPGAEYVLDESAVLYAQWSATADVEPIILPTPMREGYTFAGWAAVRSSSGGITGSFAPEDSLTLYAQWTGVLAGVLDVVKEGSPLTDFNADDEFPVTVELENVLGSGLDGVIVSDADYLGTADVDLGCGVGQPRLLDAIAGAASDAIGIAKAGEGELGARVSGDSGGILVALIDTGVPESINVVGRMSVLGEAVDDDNGHGSQMLATLSAENPDVRVLSIKALDAEGRGTGAGVYAAVERAVQEGADIINLSLAAPATPANFLIAKAVSDALDAGCAVIAAAGNGGYDASRFTPAGLEGVFTVGAATAGAQVLHGSNRGPCVDAYVTASSTSEAAARVSGWLSRRFSTNWLERFYASGPWIDVGLDAYGFVGANGDSLLEQVADSVGAAATDYTVQFVYYSNGAQWDRNSSTVPASLMRTGPARTGSTAWPSTGLSSAHSSGSRWFLTKTGYRATANWHVGSASGSLTSSTAVYSTYKAGYKAITGKTLSANSQVKLYADWAGKSVSITLNGNGGSSSSASATYGSAVGNVAVSSLANHTFNGWYTAASGGAQVYTAAGAPVRGTSYVNSSGIWGYDPNYKESSISVTLYAHFTENPKYTVTYDGNGGTPARASDTVYAGGSVSLPTATRAGGYVFKGWSTSISAASGTAAGASYVPTASVTLHAIWESPYAIVYDGNGGTADRTGDSVARGSSVILPSATRSGYDFGGWSSSSTAASGAVGSYTPVSNVTLYAVWTTTTVYDANGGTAGRSSDIVAASQSVRLPSASRSGSWSSGTYTVTYDGNGGVPEVQGESVGVTSSYYFSGWYTALSGGSYVGGYYSSYTPAESRTLYAHYGIASEPTGSVTLPAAASDKASVYHDPYVVTLDAAGGKCSVGFLNAARYTRYSLDGWNTSLSGSGQGYAPGDAYTPGSNTTLYAQWAASDVVAAVMLPTPVRPGYSFKGWAEGLGDAEGVTGSYTASADVTLHAVWSECVSSVSFNANDGEGSMPDETAYGAHEFTVPQVGFTKEGYHAVWNTEADGSGITYLPGSAALIDEPTVLYAIWSENARLVVTANLKPGGVLSLSGVPDGTRYRVVDGEQPDRWSLYTASPQEGVLSDGGVVTVISKSVYDQHVVSFHGNGGSGSMEPVALPSGTTYIVPDGKFEREGYRFAGWNTAPDGSGEAYGAGQSVAVVAGLSLYAQWASPCTVTLDANGGVGRMEPLRVFLGDAFTVPLCEFLGDRCWFRGWNTRADGTGECLNPGSAYVADGDLVLYAQWLVPTSGEAYAVLQDDGQLIFFRGAKRYEPGSGQTVVDIRGNVFSGRVYDGVEGPGTDGVSNSPWHAERLSVLSARVAGDQEIHPLDCSFWFDGCANMTAFETRGFETERTANLTNMFRDCSSLGGLDVSHWDTSNVTALSGVFENCALVEALDVVDWDTSRVRDFSRVFDGCSKLESIEVSSWDVGCALTFEGMFGRCADLMHVGDLNSWRTSRVKIMGSLFEGCSSLIELDLSGWDTSSVTDMRSLFGQCSSLRLLDVSGWDTSAAVNMGDMFSGCSSLESLNVSGFDTSGVVDMSGMFAGIGARTVDLLSFDTSGVVDMGGMFAGCPNLLWLDLGSFKTASVSNSSRMYADCPELTTIYATEHWSTENISSSEDMFFGSAKIVGGYGTPYDPSFVDAGRALIDRYGQVGYYTDALDPAAITYDANGGSGSMARTEVVRGRDATVAPNGFSPPPGKVFANWNTAPDGSGIVYAPGSGVKLVQGMTLFAQWALPGDVGAYAILTGEGDLVFFEAVGTYAEGPGQVVVDLAGAAHEGWLYVGVENTGETPPWSQAALGVRAAYVAEGNMIAPITMKGWFDGCAFIRRFETAGFNTAATESTEAMFRGCGSLEYVNLNGLCTSSVTSMASMFSGCANLADLDVSGLDTSAVGCFDRMFEGCSSIEWLRIGEFDCASAMSLDGMFAGMESLAKVDLGERFRFIGRSSALPAAPSTYPYTGRWASGSISLESGELADVFDGTVMAGTYAWAAQYPDFTVSFDANGGAGEMDQARIYEGEVFTVPPCGFMWMGRPFLRWNTVPDGTGVDYYPGEVIDLARDMTLYALWGSYSVFPSEEGLDGLLVTNEVSGVGSVTATYEFAFGDARLLFEYATSDGRSGFVSDGDRISLPSGAYLVVYGLWEGLAYQVKQVSASGWELDSSDGASGIIGDGAERGYVFQDFARWLEGFGSGDSGGEAFYTYFASEVARWLGGKRPVGDALDLAVVKAMCEVGAGSAALAWCRSLSRDEPVVCVGGDLAALGYDPFEDVADCLSAISYESLLTGVYDSPGKRLCIAQPMRLTHASFVNRASSSGAAYAVLQGDELVFFRSFRDYSEGPGTFEDVEGGRYDGYLYVGVERQVGGVAPWHDAAPGIARVRFAENQVIHPLNMHGWFAGCSALREIVATENLDTSNVLNMGSLFEGCSALSGVDVTGFDTSGVIDMSFMFSGCSSLVDVDVTGFFTQKVLTLSHMFDGASAMAELDISSFSTARASDMDGMFADMTALRQVSLGTEFSFRGDGSAFTTLPDVPANTPYAGTWYRVGGVSQGTADDALSLSAWDLACAYDRRHAGVWAWEQKATWSPGVRLELVGGTLQEGQFVVGIVECGRIVQSARNGADGSVELEGVPFNQSSEPSSHVYSVEVVNLSERFTCEGSRSYRVTCSTSEDGLSVTADSDDECLLRLTRHAVVSFDANGGVGDMRALSVVVGADLPLPDCSFTRDGYLFGGWSFDPGGESGAYPAGAGATVADDSVLFAQWEPVQLVFSVPTRIDFVLKADGDLVASDVENLKIESTTDAGIAVVGVKVGSADGFTLTERPSREGEYDFWLQAEGHGPLSASSVKGDGFMPVMWAIAKKAALLFDRVGGRCARWDAGNARRVSLGAMSWQVALRRVAVRFDANGGRGFMPARTLNAEVSFVAPGCLYAPPANMEFLHWNTKPDGSGDSYGAGDEICPVDDTILYAIWR